MYNEDKGVAIIAYGCISNSTGDVGMLIEYG